MSKIWLRRELKIHGLIPVIGVLLLWELFSRGGFILDKRFLSSTHRYSSFSSYNLIFEGDRTGKCWSHSEKTFSSVSLWDLSRDNIGNMYGFMANPFGSLWNPCWPFYIHCQR